MINKIKFDKYLQNLTSKQVVYSPSHTRFSLCIKVRERDFLNHQTFLFRGKICFEFVELREKPAYWQLIYPTIRSCGTHGTGKLILLFTGIFQRGNAWGEKFRTICQTVEFCRLLLWAQNFNGKRHLRYYSKKNMWDYSLKKWF